jgi:hypothetical protein
MFLSGTFKLWREALRLRPAADLARATISSSSGVGSRPITPWQFCEDIFEHLHT